MKHFGLVVRFDLKPGTTKSFDHLALTTLSKIRNHEPDTLLYACHAVANSPNSRIFYELYASKQAFEAHEKQDYVKFFIKEREKYLITPPRVEFFGSFEGKNLPF